MFFYKIISMKIDEKCLLAVRRQCTEIFSMLLLYLECLKSECQSVQSWKFLPSFWLFFLFFFF